MDIIEFIYDLIGIGIGPFNLGLATLADDIPELSCIFFDQQPNFHWHPGLLLDNAKMQVPFYADLVTLADPTNRFSYLNFLKAKKRLIPFGVHEQAFPSRVEYNLYCQWVACQLQNLQFNSRCTDILYNVDTAIYTVSVLDTKTQQTKQYKSRHVVIGIGNTPYVPDAVKNIHHPLVIHSSDYLKKKNKLLTKKRIAIVGAGQSAAEIFNDLLDHSAQLDELSWFTRSTFAPMDYSPFALEMASPDYIQYFHSLGEEQKEKILKEQDHLYKGINLELLRDIYDKLYMQNVIGERSIARLYPHADLQSVLVRPGSSLLVEFKQGVANKPLMRHCDALICATGYQYAVPAFLNNLKDHIKWTTKGQYQVYKNYSVDKDARSLFVQNADLHSHGFNSADLSLGPYRNAVIINSILGHEYFAIETNTTFQQFGWNL